MLVYVYICMYPINWPAIAPVVQLPVFSFALLIFILSGVVFVSCKVFLPQNVSAFPYIGKLQAESGEI